MEKDDVVRLIEEAFSGVERSSISLRQFLLTDTYGMSGSITDEAWLKAGEDRSDVVWQDICDDEIIECGCQLSHMDADEFRYYLPSYMRYSVKNYDMPVLDEMILSATVFALEAEQEKSEYHAYRMRQYSLLSADQMSAIVQFLTFLSVKADDWMQERAKSALGLYWTSSARLA